MKIYTILLVLISISCKTETRSEDGVDSSVIDMWKSYTDSNPIFKKETLPEAWYFHDNEEDANRLAQLTVNHKKTAMTSGLYEWYKEAGAELPKVGTKHIVTDFDGTARAIIKILQVDTIPFNQLSKNYAVLDMGINDEPLQKWRKAHWDFFSSVMKDRGKGEQPHERMLIVFERFETIWPDKTPSHY